jgi:Domain of unknown function (DUF4249)
MLWKTNLGFGCLLALQVLASGCDFDKVASIAIPQDPPQLFVECYLEDGKPPRLLLSRTQPYFDSVSLNPVLAGTVSLLGPTGIIPLEVGIYEDEETGKVYNWGSYDPIRLQPGDVWKLTVRDTAGHILTAQSKVMPQIPIDSVTYMARDNDSAVYLTAWLKDPAGITNYYRIVVNKDSLTGASSTTFSFQDNFRDGQEFPMRTGYVMHINNVAYVRVFSLEPSYYEFVESIEAAQRNNGNPFAQPNKLKSSITGGLGVFTTLVYDQRKFAIVGRSGRVL